MWKWLHPYAKTEKAYNLCQTLLPWFTCLALLLLVIGTVWGLAFAPPDYQQGDAFRIFYIHVPSAILSKSLYSSMAIAAFVGLVWQVKTAFMSMVALAPVGALVSFICLITGAAWGKPMWGTWWEWDARMTSQLVLLFLFLGVISLYKSFEDKQQASKAAGVMAIVGIINLPIIHYSVEWWNSLHQGATLMKVDKPSMAMDMLIPFLVCLLAWMIACGAIVLIRLQNEILRREMKRPWVITLAQQQVKASGSANSSSSSNGGPSDIENK